MASSIASMTILRSIAFSRATASAICNSSSRFALTPTCAIASASSFSSLSRPEPPGVGRSVARGVAGVVLRRRVAGRLFGAPQCVANKLVGQDQPRFGDQADRQGDLRAALIGRHLQLHVVAGEPPEDTAE